MAIKDGQWVFPEHTNLDEAVLRFFELLDGIETTDSGREFKPVQISSVRVFKTAELNKLLPQMKDLAYKRKQEREMSEWNI